MNDDQHQWSTTRAYVGKEVDAMTWVPAEDRPRLAAYFQYDDMYWNDPRQFALRVLEGEEPVYIPSARTVVNTTAHFFLKGLELTCTEDKTKKALDAFLKREEFYARFNDAKVSGVARGDWIFHLTADPKKPAGSRISLTVLEPMDVFPIWDDDQPGKMVGCHIAVSFLPPKEDDPEQKTRLRRLTYRLEEKDGVKRVSREEGIYVIENTLNMQGVEEGKAKKIKTILPFGYLDPEITAIPVYWFKNQSWGGDDFGSSELRGMERLTEVISQGSTDVTGALSLEGLGVYATDGGRPVEQNADGAMVETDWEVAPGKVMEVPSGAYFRRVDGVGSITPAIDNIHYLEEKIYRALGLSDVALGDVEATVAQSGIALAIKFLPTLARLESRDQAGIAKLTHLFYDWKTWHGVFERESLTGDIVPVIGDKLPMDRVARLNELNNMMDRKIISTKYYRSEMEKLGYEFPDDIQDQIDEEADKAFERQMANMIEAAKHQQNSADGTAGSTLPSGNQSNNKDRPNESSGTEAEKKS
jgi:hypothetical protein